MVAMPKALKSSNNDLGIEKGFWQHQSTDLEHRPPTSEFLEHPLNFSLDIHWKMRPAHNLWALPERVLQMRKLVDQTTGHTKYNQAHQLI